MSPPAASFFERFLTRESGLNRLYRDLPAEEPPAHLDQAILAAAHRAISSRPASVSRLRWQAPFALAATVLLTASLVFLFPAQETTQPQIYAPASAPAPAAQPPNQAGESRIVREQPKFEPSHEARPASTPPAAPVAEAPVREKMEAAPQQGDRRPLDKLKESLAAPSPARDLYVAPLIPDEAAESIASKAAPAPARPAERSAPLAKQKPVYDKADAAAEAPLSPEEWLASIEKLQREGREAEARASLAEFRKHHPLYKLPESLRNLEP